MPQFVSKILAGDALGTLRYLDAESVALAVTSPPYWNVKDYDSPDQIGHTDYNTYIDNLVEVFIETERVLRPNGKLAIVTPIMPLSKKVANDSHTRQLANINNDLESALLNSRRFSMKRYSLFIWQKQTTEMMFGSYPYPPNIFENNTIEFINVYVKDGRPPKVDPAIKAFSRLNQDEWLNLTMQIWPMYPADVPRLRGHPAPFPIVLPQRLIMMYTFRNVPNLLFPGDLVLDMFNGTGTTCVAAKQLGRRYLGIDLNSDYCVYARRWLDRTQESKPEIFLQRTPVRKAVGSSDQLGIFAEPEVSQLNFLSRAIALEAKL